MARTTVAQREVVEVLQVHLSDKRVVASDAQSVIPKGFRQATPEECALMYNSDQAFRDDLYRNGAVWTSQTGLNTSGAQKIVAGGKFSPTDDLYSLPVEERSYHYSGSGPVAVYVDGFYDGGGGLGVIADAGPSVGARVAYVADQAQAGSVAASPQAGKVANPIDKKTVKAARREFDAQIVKNSAIDSSAFTAVQALLEAAERQ